MLGQVREGPPFRDIFDSPDAVVPLRRDGPDVADAVGNLVLEPERRHEKHPAMRPTA